LDIASGRDSTLEARATEVRALFEAERYDEAAAAAREELEDDDDAPAAETLRTLAERADELGRYAEARAIPASDLEGNAQAYRDLAARYPSNPTYRERATHYQTRAREAREAAAQAAERAAARARPRSLYGTGTGSVGCCRRCSRGKPCGDSCIARHYTCHRGAGCAC
jgi:tetratricopeptide (TPR) repeat protein